MITYWVNLMYNVNVNLWNTLKCSSYINPKFGWALPHTQYQTYDFTRNGLLAQCTIIFHCVPYSKVTSLVSVAAMIGWPMSVILNLECCEHKNGPVWPQIGPLAFNLLRISFCTPILSPPSTSITSYHVQYHYPHAGKKSHQTQDCIWLLPS